MTVSVDSRPRVPQGGKDAVADDDWLRAIDDSQSPALLSLVMRLSANNRQQAEDIVQETLLRAWRNYGYLVANPSALRPWLFTVARRIVVDEHRKRQARPQEAGSDILEFLAMNDGVDAMLASVVVHEALASLGEGHRAVIRELYFYGTTTAEAARKLGLPKGTVKSRNHYALRALRLALAERGLTSSAG